jgi:hypothetical protein
MGARMRAAVAVPSTSDGVSALTRIPSRFASMARVRLNITMAAIAAPITDSPGVATFAASEAMLTIRPDFWARIDGNTTLHIKSGAMSCCVTMSGMSFSGISWNSSGLNRPAVEFISTSTPPRCTMASSQARRA